MTTPAIDPKSKYVITSSDKKRFLESWERVYRNGEYTYKMKWNDSRFCATIFTGTELQEKLVMFVGKPISFETASVRCYYSLYVTEAYGKQKTKLNWGYRYYNTETEKPVENYGVFHLSPRKAIEAALTAAKYDLKNAEERVARVQAKIDLLEAENALTDDELQENTLTKRADKE